MPMCVAGEAGEASEAGEALSDADPKHVRDVEAGVQKMFVFLMTVLPASLRLIAWAETGLEQ